MLALNKYTYMPLSKVEKFSENSNNYVLWKDTQHRFLGGNTKSSEMLQHSMQDYIGFTDDDVNWLEGGHAADYFMSVDKQVFSEQRLVTNENEILLKNNQHGELVVRLIMVTKRPILHNGISQGVILEAEDISNKLFPSLFKKEIFMHQTSGLLSSRETECAQLVLLGYSYKHIANKLNLSARTVEFYVQNMKEKLNCANKQQLIDKLLQLGYLPCIAR